MQSWLATCKPTDSYGAEPSEHGYVPVSSPVPRSGVSCDRVSAAAAMDSGSGGRCHGHDHDHGGCGSDLREEDGSSDRDDSN